MLKKKLIWQKNKKIKKTIDGHETI
ncbi:hypothetical protein CL3_28820 [butyrate-producing bacterium SM4/1]|nr:hypothetical protein CL3_28820 [butyrate-producing bacterium SM4/1]